MELRKILVLLLGLFMVPVAAFAASQQLDIQINEYVNQEVVYNPLRTGGGIWYDANENQTNYNITGEIVVTNVNSNGEDLADIYIAFDFTTNITLPVLDAGRNGTFISNDTSSNSLILHIPQLRNGESSNWTYLVNESNIKPPINMTANYSKTKLLAGDSMNVEDTLENVFNNAAYQTDTCIYEINLTQVTVPINFSGTEQNFTFDPSSIAGSDSGNVAFTSDNQTMYWDVLGGGCLNLTNLTDINYDVTSPSNVPTTDDYVFMNTTLEYNLNQSISHLRVIDINVGWEGAIICFSKLKLPSPIALISITLKCEID
jgi:hypothetical protein